MVSNGLIYNELSSFFNVRDLTLKSEGYESGNLRLYPGDAVDPLAKFCPPCRPLRWELLGKKFHLLASVSVHEFRSIDQLRKPA